MTWRRTSAGREISSVRNALGSNPRSTQEVETDQTLKVIHLWAGYLVQSLGYMRPHVKNKKQKQKQVKLVSYLI